jgi:D-sedoheptulose 7-phosphate isomerase
VNQNNYLVKYLNLIQKIVNDSNLSLVESLFSDLKKLFYSKGRLFLAGNGGSSAISNHAEVDFARLRYEGLNIETISLVSNTAKITADANDYGYDNTLTKAITYHNPNKDDLVLIFSSSGNSQNIINLVNHCNKSGVNTYSLLGFDGGEVEEICDNSIVLRSEKGYYGPIEDLHMIIVHLFAHVIKSDIQELV